MQREKRGVIAALVFDGGACFDFVFASLSDVLGDEEEEEEDEDEEDARSSHARSTAISNWDIVNSYSGRNASGPISPNAGSLEHRIYRIVEIPLSKAMTRRSARDGFPMEAMHA